MATETESTLFNETNNTLWEMTLLKAKPDNAKKARQELERRAKKGSPRAKEILAELEEAAEESLSLRGVNRECALEGSAKFITDDQIDPARKGMILGAKREILIQTYVFTSKLMRDTLLAAKRANPSLYIIVKCSSGPVKRGDSPEIIDALRKSKVQIVTKDSCHQKILLCDRCDLMIGSANMKNVHRDAVLTLRSSKLGEIVRAAVFPEAP